MGVAVAWPFDPLRPGRMGSANAVSPKRGRVSLVQWQGGAGRAGLLSARPAPTQPMDQDGAPPFCPMQPGLSGSKGQAGLALKL
ncbi:MAG: hypothetical protein A2X46_02495 [Lentisphaerae bacterium GWF2_57_35]|nr:MAG: hypothetical protein A2X46_02495 [Lentisphaerae bacterium GWF2_57_35]